MSTADVSIIQPYVPQYRVPLFDGLHRRLSVEGLVMRVVAPRADGEQAARRDGATDLAWLTTVRRHRSVPIGLGSLNYLSSIPEARGSSVVVLPLWGTLLDAHWALWQPRRTRRVALWGHVGSYVRTAKRIDLLVERAMMGRADHVFAYTSSGAQVALNGGVPAARVTTLNNTVDTEALSNAIDGITNEQVAEFRRRHGLGSEPTYCVIGGLDTDKRVDYLAETLAVLSRKGTDVKVLVAGHGAQDRLLEPAVDRGQVVRLGYAGVETKAMLARTCRAIVNPGRIGLVAVDALVMGLPIVTSDFPFHAPEADYLTVGQSLIRETAGPEALADRLLNDRWPSFSASPPTLGQMIEQFAAGILRMLDEPRRMKV